MPDAAIATEFEDGSRRFSGNRQDGNARSAYRQRLDTCSPFSFRQDESIGRCILQRIEIIVQKAAVERVYSDEEFSVSSGGTEKFGGHFPCRRLCLERDGIFQVEDQRIGIQPERLFHPVRPVTGDEEQRAQCHCGLRCRSALRRHWQTISLCWLISSWRKVTIPEVGRERLAFSSITSVSARIVSPINTGLGMVSLS
ncbi:hypothetical protein D3C80_996620 [compost metagenome]